MNTRISIFLGSTLAVICCLAGPARAQDAVYGQPGDWLASYQTARTAAMGGAYVANADGALGSMWNPAGLSRTLQNQVHFETADLFGECFGLERRQALWAVGAVSQSRPGRLPGIVTGEHPPTLPGMTPIEESVADLWATGVSPDEEWVSIFEYGKDPAVFLDSGGDASDGRNTLGAGRRPCVDASFAQMVLGQVDIPFTWDPFPPEQSSDPYGFGRRFHLKVPASMANEAQTALKEASEAPIDWSEIDFSG